MVNAQIVNIPDANFKAKLIALGIDTSGDGNIQNSEANLVTGELDISNSSISDISGINSFLNISKLKCISNLISSIYIDIPNIEEIWSYDNLINSLTLVNTNNLTSLKIGKNQLSSLDLSNLSSLTNLDCAENQLNNLDFSYSVNLLSLSCSLNSSTTLNVANLTNLRSLTFYGNPLITALNLNTLTNLTDLTIANCNITTLNVSALVNLKKIGIFRTKLNNIDLSTLINLEILTIPDNKLTTLDLTGLINLKNLYCSYNLFPTLDVNFLTNLEVLRYGNTNLATVDVSNMTNLQTIGYYLGNQLPIGIENLPNLIEFQACSTTFINLDVSNLLHLNTFWAAYNPLLTYINLKNGAPNGIFTILANTNPNLTYYCANDIDIERVNNGNLFDNGLFEVNSYCSFTPGGNFNTISGNVKFDLNNNGCDINDIILHNFRININDGTTSGGTFTNIPGNYSFFTQAGSFNLTPILENSTWFNLSPSSVNIAFSDDNNNVNTQNFCISPIGLHNDIEVILAPISPARPGFDAKYKIVYKNKGNQMHSGSVNFTFDDTKLDLVFANPTVANQVTNNLSWNYVNLMPFESRSIDIVLNVNSPVETPAVNNGDIFNFTTSITPVVGDELPLDNTFVYNQVVVGSFDPNDITCLEGVTVDPSEIGEYLHYVVNFENTGTFAAENIVVKDVIDTIKFDINSLQMLSTSHDAYTRINGNIVEFIFQNINLAAKSGNPAVGGHGNVLFKIKTKSNLVTGDSVNKMASIFFDYNAPVTTNPAITTFESLSNSIFELDKSVSVSPNPTTSIININSDFNIKSIEVYDVQGRILETVLGNSKSLDISSKQNGIYFLKISTDKGSKIEKIIKE